MSSSSSSIPHNMRLLKISVVSQVHKTIVFEVKGHMPLRMLVDKYFSIASVDRGDVELIYNGQRLNVQRTPNELGMKDVDTIEAMMKVHGGGGGGI